MRGAFLVFAKEVLELVRAPRTLLFTFLLPAVAYPAIIGMLGSLDARESARLEAQSSRVCLADPDAVFAALAAAPADLLVIEPCHRDTRQAIQDGRLDLAVLLEIGDAAKLAQGTTIVVRLEYDAEQRGSALAAERFRRSVARLDEEWVRARFNSLGRSPEIARPTRLETGWSGDPGRAAARKFGAILPYVLLLMMFAGSMQHGIYVTAGEKERGTLLTLLATPVPRSQVILGKIMYVFAVGLASVMVNLVSLSLSLRIAGEHAVAAWASAGAHAPLVPAVISHPSVAVLAFALLVPAGLLFANLIVFVGMRSDTTVEAGTALSPVVLGIAGLAVVSSNSSAMYNSLLAWVPVANVSLALRDLFSAGVASTEYAVALAMTIALAVLLTWSSVRALDRDSAVFRR